MQIYHQHRYSNIVTDRAVSSKIINSKLGGSCFISGYRQDVGILNDHDYIEMVEGKHCSNCALNIVHE